MKSENPAALTRECAGFSGKAKNSAANHGDERHETRNRSSYLHTVAEFLSHDENSAGYVPDFQSKRGIRQEVVSGVPDLRRILKIRQETLQEDISGRVWQEVKAMRLKNVLIVVRDIERSKRFYHDLFGLNVVLDNDGNVILTEGLVLQDEKIWKGFLGRDIVSESNSCELYFEEKDIEAFAERLQRLYPSIRYVNRLMTHSWGQKVIRFYDPDGNLIEVGTPMA